MAFAETAQLVATLQLKDQFSGPLKNANKALTGFDAKLSQTSTRAFKAGQQIGTGIRNGLKIAAIGVGLVATQVLAGLNQLAKLEDAQAQTNAVLRSTQRVAGQTADSIRALAEKYEGLNATIDDKVIQSGENVLLTFTKVRKEAFEPALLAALNMNTALGGGEGGLQKNLILVGKALNDPTKGLTALRRVGVQFTDQQVKQIKALQKSGDLLGAQRVILKELGTEFGGSFAAQGKTATGTIKGIGDAVEDLQKGLATALFPTVQRLLPRLRATIASPEFARTVSVIGDKIAGLFSDKNINDGIDALKGFFNAAKGAAPALQNAAEITGRVVKEAVGLFKSLPPELQGLIVSGAVLNKLTGGLVTNIAGGLIGAVLKSLVSAAVNINAGVVNVVGGPGALNPTNNPSGPGLVPTLKNVVKAVLPVVAAAVVARAVTEVVDPDLNKAVDNGTALSQRDPRRVTGLGTRQNVLPITRAIATAAKADDRNSLQHEQALRRLQRSQNSGDINIIRAVKDKDLSLRLNNFITTNTKIYANGRVVTSAFDRYSSTITGSGLSPGQK